MSQRTADLYLVDVIDAADAIARSVRGLSSDEFIAQPEKRDSVLWNLMIIGEAMTRLSAEMAQEMPEVPWEQIRGFRNRIVHGYFDSSGQSSGTLPLSKSRRFAKARRRCLAETTLRLTDNGSRGQLRGNPTNLYSPQSLHVRFVASFRPVMRYAKEAYDITQCSAIGLLPQRASLATPPRGSLGDNVASIERSAGKA